MACSNKMKGALVTGASLLFYFPCACHSILGGFLIVGGLYCVLWGRSKAQNHEMLKREPQGEQSPDVERD